MAEIARIVHTIDGTVDAVQPRCLVCKKSMDASPSEFFCGWACQLIWNQQRNAGEPVPPGPGEDDLGEALREQREAFRQLAAEQDRRRRLAFRAELIQARVEDYWPEEPSPPGLFESLWNLLRRRRKR